MSDQDKILFEAFKKTAKQSDFTCFFEAYYSRLLRFASTFVSSSWLAEEIIMDIFMKLWEQKHDLARIRNIETYLYVSVRNSCISAIRREKKFSFDMLDDIQVELQDYKITAENNLIEQEMANALNHAVANLPSKCKMIFKLIREEGLKRNEVAEILDISAKTVDNQVAIAVGKIAKELNVDISISSQKKKLTYLLLSF